jgi:hypothetical protein
MNYVKQTKRKEKRKEKRMENYHAVVSEIIREAEEQLGDKFKENVSRGKQSMIKEFLGALVSCGELTEVNRERIEKNPALKEYFQQPIDMEIETDDSFVKGSIGDKLRMSGVEVVKYDYDGDTVLWNKDTRQLLDMDDGSYIGATMKCNHKGDWYPVLCDEEEQEDSDEEDEVFEGKKIFPENQADVTFFIMRYIEKEWPEMELCPHPGTGWMILKKGSRYTEHPVLLHGSSRTGSIESGTVTGTYSDGKNYKINLRGKKFKALDQLLCIV